jgi:hypothetical protein
MSLSLTISTEKGQESWSLDMLELEVVRSAAQNDAELSAAFKLLFDAPDFGEPKRVSGPDVLHALRLFLSKEKSLRMPIYRLLRDSRTRSSAASASGLGGVRIANELFMMDGGVNRCTLTKLGPKQSDGLYSIVSVTDIRHLKSIDTDNMGVVKIQKRSRSLKMIRLLRELEGTVMAISRPEMLLVLG